MRVAAVQMDVTLGETSQNVDRMIEFLGETGVAGAKLAVFPECAVSGYCFGSADAAREFAQSIPGPATERISVACAEQDMFAVFGMLEASGEDLFNAAVLVGPQGVIGGYRKVHLPFLGIDRFTAYGDQPFAVHNAGDLRIGMNICYDASFPEAARSLAILGADLIVLPTNWPPGSQCAAGHVINARAMENGVYYVAVNRVGTEAGFTFIGRSKIADPSGRTLAESTQVREEILYADVDPARARCKHIVRVPGEHEIDRLADRRPEMYHLLTQPHDLKSPGRE